MAFRARHRLNSIFSEPLFDFSRVGGHGFQPRQSMPPPNVSSRPSGCALAQPEAEGSAFLLFLEQHGTLLPRFTSARIRRDWNGADAAPLRDLHRADARGVSHRFSPTTARHTEAARTFSRSRPPCALPRSGNSTQALRCVASVLKNPLARCRAHSAELVQLRLVCIGDFSRGARAASGRATCSALSF